MTATYCGLWLLFGALPLIAQFILRDLARDERAMATARDIDRIEAGLGVIRVPAVVALGYRGRHRAGSAKGSSAQVDRASAMEQGWNVYTQPLPILDALDAIGITAPAAAWPTRQTPTDLALAYELAAEPAPDVAELFIGVELLAIGGRRA